MLFYQVVDPVYAQGNYEPVYQLGHVYRRQTGVAAHRRAVRRALIDLNKAVAGLLGMDPHYTICTNLAWRVSQQTGMPFEDAKRAIHVHIALHVARALRAHGIVQASPAFVSRLIFDWLESFDSSTSW